MSIELIFVIQLEISGEIGFVLRSITNALGFPDLKLTLNEGEILCSRRVCMSVGKLTKTHLLDCGRKSLNPLGTEEKLQDMLVVQFGINRRAQSETVTVIVH